MPQKIWIEKVFVYLSFSLKEYKLPNSNKISFTLIIIQHTFCFLTRINILFHYYSFSLVFMLSSDNFKWQFQTKFQTEILILTGSARFLWAVGNTRMWAQLVTTYLLLSQKITDWSKISVELTQGNQSVSYLNLNPINRVFEAIDLCTLQPRMNASKIDLFIVSKGVKYAIKSLPSPLN